MQNDEINYRNDKTEETKSARSKTLMVKGFEVEIRLSDIKVNYADCYSDLVKNLKFMI